MKSEPDAYAWEQLVKDGTGIWDGVRNHTAKLNMMAMKAGDEAFFYHSNIGRNASGSWRSPRKAFPTRPPKRARRGSWCASRRCALAHPVTLAAIKADRSSPTWT